MLVHHRYTSTEAGAALGMTADEVNAAAKRLGITTELPDGPRPRVLPYPGGRHPRIGFLDGAIRPQRETKVSLFAPWADGGYAVADVPEAVWHDTASGSRKLLYLAHTHLPTLWDEQGQTLPPLEWATTPDGSFEVSRPLPNKVTLTSRVTPGRDGTRMEFRVTNGSTDDPDRARRPDVRDAQGPEGLRASVERQQGLPTPLRRRPRRLRPSLDHHRLGRLQAGLGQRGLPLPSLRPSCPGLPAGRVTKRQGMGVVL